MTQRKKATAALGILILGAIIVTGLSSFATQTVAARFAYHPLLGASVWHGLYQPFSWISWQAQPWAAEFPRVFLPWKLGAMGGLIVVGTIVFAGLASGGATQKKLVAPPGGGLVPLERGVTDNHGHAAWARKEQIAERFSGPGCLIGAVERNPEARLIFSRPSDGPGHSLIFAGSGSHKTMSAITRLWHWDGPRLVFDPSCEIGPIMEPALTEAGFKVISIGLNGGGVNVLDWINVQEPEADAHIRAAVEWVVNEGASSRMGGEHGHDRFWVTWGKALVTCLMAHMLHAPSGPRTLAALRQGVATPEAEMQALLAGIHSGSSSRMARDIAGGLMGMKAPETFSGIYSNAFVSTEYLSVDAYAAVVSGSSMRTVDVLDPNTVVFIQLPLRTMLATPAIGRAVIGSLFNAVFHADAAGSAEDRILAVIDEAWLLGPMREIKLCHATARKYRLAVQTLWQSESQLDEIWGRDGAKILRDTVSWRSYNAVQDGDVAERLSRDIGSHAVLAYSEGDNAGTQKPWSPLAFGSRSKGANLNVHEIARRLIRADEIMRAPADEMYVLARDCPNPIRCVSAPYFRIPELNRRMAANRFAKA